MCSRFIKLDNGMYINLDKITKFRQSCDEYYVYLDCDLVAVSEEDYYKILGRCMDGN